MSPSRVDEELLGSCQYQTTELPILRTKPPYEQLLKSLKDLELPPTAWSGASMQNSTIEAKSVSQYLLSIISSDLGWLEDNGGKSEAVTDQKDELWELASRRLAERCGRSAMPEMIRTWIVSSSARLPELQFEIREPPLTGDNLGLKTWGTAFVIVKKLEEFGSQYFGHILDLKNNNLSTANTISQRPGMRVLELGSGTGLVGIAAGAIWGTEVILTDLPEIKENLLFNIERNKKMVESFGGGISGDVLDWKDPKSLQGYYSTEFEIIIAADSLYDEEHPELVAQNIKRYLKPHTDSRALVAIPLRDSHTKLMAANFRQLMQDYGFDLLHHGEEICHDDWAEADEEEAVKCWWGLWKPTCAP